MKSVAKTRAGIYQRLVWLICLWIFSQSAKAQSTGTLMGQVTSEGKGIGYATVMVVEAGPGTVADEHGHYTLRQVPVGKQKIEIRLVGYKTKVEEVVIKAGEQTQINFVLEEDMLHLESVVVTATRGETKRREAPVIVNVIDNRLFQATQSLSLSEGLSFQPGLRLENNCQNCGFTQVRMNGLNGPYSQILIDSRAVFSALNGVYGLDQIPTNMIDRIEVVRGGGSALYGANAIAGTINIITKDPINNTYLLSTSNALIDGEASDYAVNVNGSLVADDLKSGLNIFGIKRSREEYDANGDGFSEITQLRNNSFGFKGYYKPAKQQKIKLEFHSIDEFRRGGNLFDRPAHQADIAEQLDHKTVGGQLSYEVLSPNLKHKYAVYTSVQTIERLSYYGGGGNSDDPVERDLAARFYGNTDDFSSVSGIQYSYNMKGIMKRPAILTLGTELQYNDVDDRMPGYSRVIQQAVLNTGSYVQLEFRPLTRMKMLLGTRYDQTNVDGTYDFGEGVPSPTERNFNVLNPRATFLYDLTSKLKLRAGYASGFRAPQAFDEDLHIETLDGSAQFIRLSDNLEKETSDSYTLSLDYIRKIGATDANITVEGFYTHLNNPFINEFTGETLPISGASVVEKRNGSGAVVSGANIEVKLAPSRAFIFQMGGTIQQAVYDETEVVLEEVDDNTGQVVRQVTSDRLLRTPDVYGFFASTISPTDKLAFYISGVYTGPMLVPNERLIVTRETQDFLELNLKCSYEIKLKRDFQLQLNGGVQNVLNSYQPDFEMGPDRDSGYIYGPNRPVTYFLGLKLGNFL